MSTARARAIPTATARDAASALDDVLRARTASRPVSDEFFEGDWTALWADLATGGWTTIGDATMDAEALDLLDLTLIAETWGAHLVPLPLVETIAVRHLLGELPPPTRRLSYAVCDGDTWLSPFGRTSDVVSDIRSGVVVPPNDVRDDDEFAHSLPIAILRGPFHQLPAEGRATIAILTTAGAVGAAASALATSVAYANVREQFGRPIGSFQAVKHRLADMHARAELARSAMALSCADRAQADGAIDLALDLCLRIAEDAIQVHGGIGFTWEATLHRHLRHVLAARRLANALLAP
jgi:alkylation response protein AidB-like acyl-CoA dehydrogenase